MIIVQLKIHTYTYVYNYCVFFTIGYNDEYIDILLHAVKLALDELEIPLETTTKHNFPERHLQLQTCQNIISSILEGASDQLHLTKELRLYDN